MLHISASFARFTFHSFALVVLLLILNLFSMVASSAFYAFIALIIFGLFALALLRHSPPTFFLLLLFIFFRATTLLSGIFIESGAHMVELGSDGYASGAFIRLTMVYIFFIWVASLAIEMGAKPKQDTTEDSIKLIDIERFFVLGFCVTLAILLAFTVLIGLKNGFPIFTNVDRFIFKQEVSNIFYSQFIHARIIIVLLLGFMLATAKGSDRKVPLGFFAAVFVVSILFQEKFTSIVSILITFMLPTVILKSLDFRYLLPRVVILISAISVITIPTILFVYGFSDDSDGAVDRLFTRMAAQGQLWFVADEQISHIVQFKNNEIVRNIKAMLSLSPSHYSLHYPFIGMFAMMNDYMSADRLGLYMMFNITLTFGFEAYLLQLFGYVGMIPALILFAVIFGLTLRYLQYGIVSYSPIRIFIAARLLIWVNFGLQQGELHYILGTKVAMFTVLAIAYEIFIKNAKPSKV